MSIRLCCYRSVIISSISGKFITSILNLFDAHGSTQEVSSRTITVPRLDVTAVHTPLTYSYGGIDRINIHPCRAWTTR